MSAHIRTEVNDLLLQRVYSEFLEMPGLRLTSRQAQRLWGLDEPACLQIMEFLVDARFLCRVGKGEYARLTAGEPAVPRPRMAKANLDQAAQPRSKRTG